MTSLIASILLLMLAMHPYVTYPLSLWLLSYLFAAPSRAHKHNGELPSVSICFCAFNEAEVIAEKILNLESVAKVYPGRVEILMYADGCTDSTVQIAQANAETSQVFAGKERLGKSAGMNHLVGLATGDLVVFTDANVMLDDETLPRLAATFQDETIGCVCGRLVYTNDEAGGSALVGSLYWKLEEFIKSLESAIGSTMGADGALFAIRKSLYRKVPHDIIDDMYTSLSILCDGFRVVSVPDAFAYEKNATSSADEFRRKVRIACRSFNCHRYIFARLVKLNWLDIYKYASHKLIRWMTAYFLFGGFVFGLVAAIQLGLAPYFLAIAALAGIVFVLGLLGVPKLRGIADVLLAFAAVGIGVCHSIQGHRYQTWLPPQSAR